MTAIKVQKITFLIFKSLTLRQKYGTKLRFSTVFLYLKLSSELIFEVVFSLSWFDPYLYPYRTMVERMKRSMRSALSRFMRNETVQDAKPSGRRFPACPLHADGSSPCKSHVSYL